MSTVSLKIFENHVFLVFNSPKEQNWPNFVSHNLITSKSFTVKWRGSWVGMGKKQKKE